jgi:hypothetical protein
LPASPHAVEIKAAPKARPSPTSASKNFIQTSAEDDCSHCATLLEGTFFMESVYTEDTAPSLASAGRTINEDGLADNAIVTRQ